MSAPPRLSVGIPTYNQAGFLEETLGSLLHQKVMPDEIVISDHFSTDSTPDLIQSFVARYPGLIRSVQPPPGTNLTGQYNFTLLSQTCEWITLLSSDDLALPNFCQTLRAGAARSPDAVLVRAPWRNIDSSGAVQSHDYLVSVPREERTPANLISQRNGPKVSFAAFAIKRSAFVASGPILGSIESLADWALFAQLAPFGSYIKESEIVSSYRVGHDGDKFRRRSGMWIRDEWRMFSEVLPTAADRLGLKDRDWIKSASRDNFVRYLTAAAREFHGPERGQLLPDFAPWAESLGESALLNHFAQGGAIRAPFRPSDVARRALRPFAQRLAHLFAARP